jgi:hypothetical protein
MLLLLLLLDPQVFWLLESLRQRGLMLPAEQWGVQ